MKNLKSLTVTVNYTVGLGNLDIPEKEFNQLVDAYDNADEIDGSSNEYGDLSDWLANNIREKDCVNIHYEIDDFEE